MRREQYDPLPFDLWLSELGKLAEASAIYAAEHEDRAVRRAFYLFKLAPPSIRRLGDPDLDEAVIELMLERGEAAHAARLIAGDRASITTERQRGRQHSVRMTLSEELSARGEGASPALALVSAWADLLRKAPERVLVRLAAAR